MPSPDILERDRSGVPVSVYEPGYDAISRLIREAQLITAELNTGYHEEEEVRSIFSRLIGIGVDETFGLLPPFHTDFGKNIRWADGCSSTLTVSSWIVGESLSAMMF